jgi:hypothetical protein
MISRLILNLKEHLGARVVDGGAYDYNTVDITMSEIIFRQLEDLGVHDVGHTIDPGMRLHEQDNFITPVTVS